MPSRLGTGRGRADMPEVRIQWNGTTGSGAGGCSFNHRALLTRIFGFSLSACASHAASRLPLFSPVCAIVISRNANESCKIVGGHHSWPYRCTACRPTGGENLCELPTREPSRASERAHVECQTSLGRLRETEDKVVLSTEIARGPCSTARHHYQCITFPHPTS